MQFCRNTWSCLMSSWGPLWKSLCVIVLSQICFGSGSADSGVDASTGFVVGGWLRKNQVLDYLILSFSFDAIEWCRAQLCLCIGRFSNLNTYWQAWHVFTLPFAQTVEPFRGACTVKIASLSHWCAVEFVLVSVWDLEGAKPFPAKAITARLMAGI